MEQKTNKEISKLLKQFNEDPLAEKLVDKYCAPLIYDEAFGIYHSEKLHTSFLIWIMKQGRKIPVFLQDFKEFLKIICERGISQNCVSKDVKEIHTHLSNPNTIISLKEEAIKQEVKTSYGDKNKDQKNPRVDIVIDIDIYNGNDVIPVKIIIENKIFSKEHDNQTKIYYGYFSEDNAYIKTNLSGIKFYKKEKKKEKIEYIKKKLESFSYSCFYIPSIMISTI